MELKLEAFAHKIKNLNIASVFLFCGMAGGAGGGGKTKKKLKGSTKGEGTFLIAAKIFNWVTIELARASDVGMKMINSLLTSLL